MNVLIACEYSNTVAREFRLKGHKVISCDILENEEDNSFHYKGDVFDLLKPGHGFELMIAFPPCTYITYAGTRYWNELGRVFKRLKALEFFARLLESDIPKICIENPVGCADAVIRKPDQIIHPYYFGDQQMKRTYLWLKNLPKLQHQSENNLFGQRTHTEKPEPIYIEKSGAKRYFTDAISGSKNGGHKRSKFFPGIAKAMAEQWG